MSLPSTHPWQFQEAKNKLSQVVDLAQTQGPQIITRHGKEAAVVLSFAAYQELSRPRTTLLAFFESSPLYGMTLDTTRSTDTGREIDL
jgi:antitoxin Phd